MISDFSKFYLTKKNNNIYNKYKKKLTKQKFVNMIVKGILPRPHYALGLYLAAQQAVDLGYKKLKIIEFGCHNLDGLIDLEHYANDIKKFLKINFQIFGFTLKAGLPKYKKNPYDRLYRWGPGETPFTIKKNLKKLKSSKVIFGDIKTTLPNFLRNNLSIAAPIGFIMYDLNYYTSTKYSFEILKKQDKFFLPRLINYFDDNSFSTDQEGEIKAILEFNNNNKKKLSHIHELAEILSTYYSKWIFLGKRFRIMNNFNHKKYMDKVSRFDDLL